MIALTDIFVFIFILIFVIAGYQRGFWGTIVGPLSTVLTVFLSYYFFNRLNNPLLFLILLLAGPIVFSVILSVLLSLWRKNVDYNKPIHPLSRFLGAAISTSWGGLMTVIIILFIAIMPSKVFKLKSVQENVLGSYSYSIIEQSILAKIPQFESVQNLLKVYEDNEKAEEISSNPYFFEIYYNQKVQDLIADETVTELINNKDIFHLLTNEKVIDIWRDKNLMKKLLELSEKSSFSEPEEEELPPKVYEIDPEGTASFPDTETGEDIID